MNNPNCNIRFLREDDLKQVAELYSLFWNEEMKISKMKEKFRQLSDNPNCIILVAERNQEIIGTIQGIICDELYGECVPFLVMENFVVAESARGMGVGRNLLKGLEKIGEEKKCSQIIFITESDRKDSIDFYERMGFNSSSHIGFKKSLK